MYLAADFGVDAVTAGYATTALGRRKPIIVPCVMLCGVFLTISLACEQAWAVSVCFTLYTVLNYFRCPASGTIHH